MKTIVTATAVLAMLAGTVLAEENRQLEGRKGQFNILALNVGILGGMAKGAMPYDAEAAQAAADSIVGVSMVHQATLFPEGSDSMSIDDTRAQPNIWDNFSDFESKWAALGDAAKNMQTVAATGQEAIGPALGQLGGACKACHDTYRAPE